MLFVVHAVDKTDMLPTRAKFYCALRVHLDDAVDYDVDVVTAGTLVADDGETPVGSVFVIDAKNRAAADAFTRSDPYHVNKVWETVQIHGYNKKRGTPIVSRRAGLSSLQVRPSYPVLRSRAQHGVSKDGCTARTRGHPSRRAQKRALRMRRPCPRARCRALPAPGGRRWRTAPNPSRRCGRKASKAA